MRWQRPYGILFFLILGVLSTANGRETAPQFTASTLKGQTFTSEALKGRVVLLEFWTTWCHVCRGDQPALDNISREFSSKGLVVLAVDAYESGDTVKKYLEENPRSCNVVLGEDTTLIAQFKPMVFPYYVLIDRDGTVAGTQEGGGGEPALRDLLGDAGLGDSSVIAMRSSDRATPVPKIIYPSSQRLNEGQPGSRSGPPKPLPPAVFVLKNGEKFEARHYTIMPGSLRISDQPNPRTIPLAALDVKATIAANHERGIDLRIPTHQNEVFLGL
jgi:thiol-disulfide isomerase/thioredoxin